MARKAGLEVHDIPNFSRADGGGDIGKSPAVLQAAFSQDVLDARLSSIVELEKGRGVVLSATDHVLPQQKPLEAVRADVVAAWKKARGAELAGQAAAEAVKRLTAGEPWDSVAKSLGAAPEAPKFVARSDQAVPLDVRKEAFDGPKPAGKPVYSNVALTGGDAAVVQVSAVRQDPGGDAKADSAEARREFAQAVAAAETQGYAAAARADSKVILNPQALD